MELQYLYALLISHPHWLAAILFLILPSVSFLFLSKPRNVDDKAASLNLPPSPPRLPILGNLHQLGKLAHRSLWQLSQKHGPVILLRLGQVPTLVVSSPEMAKQVLKTNDSVCCSRPYSHGSMTLSYNYLDVIFGPYSEYWKEMRKLCVSELFNAKRVQSFSHFRELEVARLIDSISEFCSSNNPIELDDKIFSFANNVLCHIVFGKIYEGKQFESYAKFRKAIDEAMAMLSSFWVADFFPKFGWIVDALMGHHRRLERCFDQYDAFFESVIEEHRDANRQSSGQEDIIDVLLRLSEDKAAPAQLSKQHIKSLLLDLFLGAINTSSLTIVWAMTELVRNPRILKKAQAEIRDCIGKKERVSEHEIAKLKYLKMVVKETFRLHPPAPLLVPRESMHHCHIAGYDVPPNTRIYVNAWAIGRDPNTWSPNAEEFCPERFEENEVDFRGQHFELIPFGAGRRICPGMLMGSINVELVLANLLHCFDWDLPLGMKGKDISLEEEAGITVHKKYPLLLVPLKYDWNR